MNIFALDTDPGVAARAHYDCHVVKMILESAQLLSTAWHVKAPRSVKWYLDTDNDDREVPFLGRGRIYRQTHVNHPCAIWAREHAANYRWLWQLADALCTEYEFRFDKTHATRAVIDTLQKNPLKGDAGDYTTPFAVAIPDAFKQEGNIVAAYREYYSIGKAHLRKYTRRAPPAWLTTTH